MEIAKIEKTKIIEQIIQNQRLVSRFLRQFDPELWLQLNLTIAQVKSLFFISNKGSANFRMLAAALKVTPSNVTGIIDRLVEQGLVSRSENPDDRRMLMLKLTPEGENLIQNLRERRASQLKTVLDQISIEDLKTISQGFTLLAQAVENFKDTG